MNDKHHGVAAKDVPISKLGSPQLPCMFLLLCEGDMRCPECREESITILQVREAAISRDIPHGKPAITGFRGGVLRYECECLRCHRQWKPRNQKQADDLFNGLSK